MNQPTNQSDSSTIATCESLTMPVAGRASPANETGLSAWEGHAVWLFIGLGLLVRSVRYGLRFPLWEDECFLCANLIDRSYAELLQPLDYNQVAPFLFLWLQKFVVSMAGFHEAGLRLTSFAASIISLFLFRHLVIRLLRGPAVVMAVATFAVGYPAIRYAAEAKPYGIDLCASLLLLALFVEWNERTSRVRWLWWMAVAVLPLAMMSFPVAFVGGGLSLVILAVGIRHRSYQSPRFVCGWIGFNTALLTGFLTLWTVSAGGQNAGAGEAMRSFWGPHFPPQSGVIDLARWAIVTHASDVAAWPIGGPNGASAATFVIGLVGLAAFIRSRRWAVLGMCLMPAGINVFAAALRMYPYGGHMKLAIYLGPAVCLLFAAGLAELQGRLSNPQTIQRACAITLALLGSIGMGSIARDAVFPYKAPSDERARAFAQWFWPSTQFDGEVVCLQSDLHEWFVKAAREELNWSAQYFCNQHIYSERHRDRRPPDFTRIQDDWPLRCVQYRLGGQRFPFDQQAFDGWLAEMQSRYVLEARDVYSIPRYDKHDRVLVTVDYIDVLKFVPRRTADGRNIGTLTNGNTASLDDGLPLR